MVYNTNYTLFNTEEVIDFLYFTNITIFICCFFKFFKIKLNNRNNLEEIRINNNDNGDEYGSDSENNRDNDGGNELNIYELSENEVDKILNKECSICLDQFKQNTSILKLNCNHIFHYDCINEWIFRKPECPECRRNIFII